MDFIENLRQWTSERFDDLTGQENVYHQSTGKTQKEYDQDIDFYKQMEDAVRKSAIVLGALDGAALGGAHAVGMGPVMGAATVATDSWLGHFLPYFLSTVEKNTDNNENGETPVRDNR